MTYDSSSPTVSCVVCHGEGGHPGSPHSSPPDPCYDCGGSGRVPFVARTEDFLAAVAALDARKQEQAAHRERTIREAVVPAYVAAVQAARPRAPAFLRAGEEGSGEALYLGVREWARAYLKPTAFDAVEAPLVEPFTAEQERIGALAREADQEVGRLAPWAVFRATTERIEVYRPYSGVYSSQGFGQDSYLRADCAIRVAVLKARGFDAETVPIVEAKTEGAPVRALGTFHYGPGYRVLANAPPELRRALPSWRLDDQRLLDATHPANLKVLFGGMFPYAGSWDWPAAKRERRDYYSFQIHRANEDAHLLLNRGPT